MAIRRLAFLEIALILALGLSFAVVTVEGSGWVLAVVLLLGTSTVAAWGWALANLANADGAIVAVYAIYIPMLLLCGAFVPLEIMPRALQNSAAI